MRAVSFGARWGLAPTACSWRGVLSRPGLRGTTAPGLSRARCAASRGGAGSRSVRAACGAGASAAPCSPAHVFLGARGARSAGAGSYAALSRRRLASLEDLHRFPSRTCQLHRGARRRGEDVRPALGVWGPFEDLLTPPVWSQPLLAMLLSVWWTFPTRSLGE